MPSHTAALVPKGKAMRALSRSSPRRMIREARSADIMKGYKVDTDSYIEITRDELDGIALESTRTIEIDQFVPKSEIVLVNCVPV